MEVLQLFQRSLRQTLVRSPQCKSAPLRSRRISTATSTRTRDARHSAPTLARCFSSTTIVMAETGPESPAANRASTQIEGDLSNLDQPQPSTKPSTAFSTPLPSTYSPRRPTNSMFKAIGQFTDPNAPRVPLEDQLDVFGIVDPPKARPKADAFDAVRRIDPVQRYRQASTRTPIDQSGLYNTIMDTKTDDYKLPALRLKPTLGRTVSLDANRSMDLTRAFRQLEMDCARNQVRSDARTQKTYVRRGQRRKIDRMRRWRALFQVGFMEECGRVRRMRAQGW